MKKLRIILGLAALVLVPLVVTAVFTPLTSSTCPPGSRQRPVAAPTVGPWYRLEEPGGSGGTLHSATVKEWREASERNRLATCWDFVATTYRNKGVADKDIDIAGKARALAVELMACIDKATSSGQVDHQQVSVTASVCLVRLDFDEE